MHFPSGDGTEHIMTQHDRRINDRQTPNAAFSRVPNPSIFHYTISHIFLPITTGHSLGAEHRIIGKLAGC